MIPRLDAVLMGVILPSAVLRPTWGSRADVAVEARGSLQATTAAAVTQIETLTVAIATVQHESARLAENRATVSAQIRAGAAAATEILTTAVARRAGVLEGELAAIFDDRDGELTLQVDALQVQLANQQIVFTTGQEALEQGDVQVVESRFQISQ